MYAVSNAYKTAMKAASQNGKITGTVGNVSFTEANIVSGSLTVQNQLADSEIILGAVYVGELTCTFTGLQVSRYTWVGKVITLSYWQEIGEDEWEEVPLGIFTVDSAEHTEQGVSVTAYDRMMIFDKPCNYSTATGAAYDLLILACTECGVTLGMTQAEVEELPNSSYILNMYGENDISTWRDYLSQLSAALGAFCRITRDGKLVLKRYQTSAADTIDWTDRNSGGSFADFETRFTAVSLDVVEAETMEYFADDPDDGLTYSLGANPFLQSGVKTLRETMCRNILASLGNVDYVPFNFEMLGNPAYDLGDVLVFSNGIGDATKKSCLTAFSWTFNGAYQASGAGTDPALANADGKLDKEIANAISQISATETRYYTYTNAGPLTIEPNASREIVDIRFATITKATVIFQAEVLLSASVDDTVGEVTYYLNNVEVSRHPTETWIDGSHILHLLYVIRLNDSTLYRFTAELKATGGKITIPAYGVHAVISGRGLAAEEEFDGYIDIIEPIRRATLSDGITGKYISEEVEAEIITPVSGSTSDYIRKSPLDSIHGKRIHEVPSVGKDLVSAYTWSEISDSTWAQIEDGFIWG